MSFESRGRNERRIQDWRWLVACGAVGAALLAGCDNKDSSSTATAESPASTATKTAQPKAAPATGRPDVSCETIIRSIDGRTVRVGVEFKGLPDGAKITNDYQLKPQNGPLIKATVLVRGRDGNPFWEVPYGFFAASDTANVNGYDVLCANATGTVKKPPEDLPGPGMPFLGESYRSVSVPIDALLAA